jgi:hypothetical protein
LLFQLYKLTTSTSVLSLQKLFAYCDELQVNKADRTEVDLVTYCDELQVNKSDRTDVDVVTHCDELQVDKVC